uniref:F-box domain-containing protein n=1 Tax=Gigaspora margarita TaxID=4874 RepID=A0A8H3XHB9_GIGMA
MASKIFMGDMPELMENILNNLNDIHSLHSCVLVSRFWSKMSIPILWSDPFSLGRKSSFIPIYLSSLNEHDIFILNECGIVVEFPNTLFNYANFLKVMDLSALDCLVEDWIELSNINLHKDSKMIKYELANLLFKLFIERGAILSKFDLWISDDSNEETFDIKPEIFYLLGRNGTFFSQLQELSVFIKIKPCPQNAITLLKILIDNAKKINTLKFTEFYYDPQLFHTLSCVIKSQEQIKCFSMDFVRRFGRIISSLRYQQNSLREVIMENCDFSSKDFDELMNCKNLEVIRMYQCDNADRLLNRLGNSLYKINTLDVCSYSIDAWNIIQLLQKSGKLLQRLRISSDSKEIHSFPKLLEILISSCPNIVYLDFSCMKLSTQFLNFICCLQKLQFLTFTWIDDGTEEEMKTCVTKFAEMLPLSLNYLDLGDFWNISSSHIDVFLNHCNAPLKKLLLKVNDDEKVVEALIGFYIRKKTLNMVYLYDLGSRFESDLKKYVELVPYDHIEVDC